MYNIENTSAKRSITVGNFAEISVLFCFLLEEEMKKFLVKNINSVQQFFSVSVDLFQPWATCGPLSSLMWPF
jgi:hypothetical protein